MVTQTAALHARGSLLFLPFLLIVSSGCPKQPPEEERSCPCAQGWSCCPSQQRCLPEGVECPGGADAGGDGGIDAGVVDGGPLHLLVKKTARPLSIDGQLDDAVWTLPHSIARTNSGSNDNTAHFGVVWDDAYLYVGVKVLDSNLHHDSAESWEDDSVEVYVDGAGEGSATYDANDRHFAKGWNNALLSTAQSGAGVLHGVANITGGYTVELAIPWSNLGVVSRANMTLGFDVQQNDDDNGGARDGVMSWNATTADNYKSTVDFGRLTLSSEFVGGTGGGGGTTGGGGGTTGGGGGTTGGGGGATGGGGGATGGGGGTTGGGGGATGGGGGATGPTWQPVPMRTAAQVAAGIAGGEGEQMVFGFAYAPSNPRIVYMAVDTSRVWKSTDGGLSWQLKSRGFLSQGGVSIVVDPADSNIVLVAGSLHAIWSPTATSPADGIWRTTDGGESWRNVRVSGFRRQRTGVHFAFNGTGGTVYAATHDDGILRSTDHGATWSALGLLAGQQLSDITIEPGGSALVAAPTGLYRITTSPLTAATRIGLALPAAPAAVVIHPTDSRIIYVTVPSRGVFKSTNAGVDFISKSAGLDTVLNANASARLDYLAISPRNASRLYVSFHGVWVRHPFYSDDAGESWHQATDMDPGGLVSDLTHWTSNMGFEAGSPVSASPLDERVAIAMAYPDRPVVTSDGGRTWTYGGAGFMGGMGNTAWGSNGRVGRFRNDYGPYLSLDNGATYKRIPVAQSLWRNGRYDTAIGALDPTPGSRVVVVALGTYTNQVPAVTGDDGMNWTVVEQATDGSSTADNYSLGLLVFHPQNANIIYMNGLKSTDKGVTWGRLARRVGAVFPSNGNIVYGLSGCSVHKSTDAGATWSAPYGDFAASCGGPVAMAVDSGNQDKLYVINRSQGVYVRESSGWVRRAEADGLARDAFGQHAQTVIAADATRPNVVYVGSYAGWIGHSNGVFMSSDGGRTWRNISYNLGPELNVDSLNIDPRSGDLYCSGFAGVWRLPRPN